MMWTMLVGTRVPLLLGAELPAGRIAYSGHKSKPSGRSGSLAKSGRNVLAVRGSVSPIIIGYPESAEELELPPEQQVFKDGEGSDKVGDACGVAREQGSPVVAEVAGRRELIAGSAAVLAAALCACCSGTVEAASRAPSTLKWEYGSVCGPVKWGSVCTIGRRQSPINFALNKVKPGKSSEDLKFDYGAVAPMFMNTGHGTMQVNFLDKRNKLRIGNRSLDLLQFHFHTPSEHTFNGVHYNMEAHLVHRDPKSKSLAVVGVMLEAKGSIIPNKALQAALDYSPREKFRVIQGPTDFTMSPSLLLPASGRGREKRGYMHYTGSLTTPPCSEGVDWFVMETPVSISSQQVLDFMKFVGDFETYASNARPLQPLGSRVVDRGPTS